MLAKLKVYALMALSLLAALLGFLWKNAQSRRFKEKAKAEKARADAQTRISKELVDGGKRMKEKINDAKKSDPYDHFSR